MRKLPMFVIATIVIQLGISLIGAAPASADPSCTIASGVLSITNDFANGRYRIDVWQDTNDQVWVNVGSVPAETFCSDSPIMADSVRTIKVNGGAATDYLFIWMTQTAADLQLGGPNPVGNAPAADWGTTTWEVDLGTSLHEKDILYVNDFHATHGLTLTAGDSGIDLDGDGHLDVPRPSNVVKIEVDVIMGAAGGRNVISMAGDATTGGPVKIRTLLSVSEISGDPTVFDSHDIFKGGRGRDIIVGGGGDDRISGGLGDDMLLGGSGDDRVSGGPGNDGIQGGSDHDVCSGGPDRDHLDCEVIRPDD